MDHIQKFLTILKIKYDFRNLGSPTTHLRWTIHQKDEGVIHITQPVLIKKILENHNMQYSNHRTTPLPKTTDVDYHSESTALDATEAESYLSFIGYLRYLAKSKRLNISVATSSLIRYLQHPTNSHWNSTRHILTYLKTNSSHGIL